VKFSFENTRIMSRLSDAGMRRARAVMKSWSKQEKLRDILQFFSDQKQKHISGITVSEIHRGAFYGLIPVQECSALCSQLARAGDLIAMTSKDGTEYAYSDPHTENALYSGKYDDAAPSPLVPDQPNTQPSWEEIYEKFIEEMEYHGECLEETTASYRSWKEPDFRNSFMPLLKRIGKSYTVTAETFDREGKADIVIKGLGSENLFVVERKLWNGSSRT